MPRSRHAGSQPRAGTCRSRLRRGDADRDGAARRPRCRRGDSAADRALGRPAGEPREAENTAVEPRVRCERLGDARGRRRRILPSRHLSPRAARRRIRSPIRASFSSPEHLPTRGKTPVTGGDSSHGGSRLSPAPGLAACTPRLTVQWNPTRRQSSMRGRLERALSSG